MLTLDSTGRFVSAGKPLGIIATRSRNRWQYRDDNGTLYASGIDPATFAKRFWFRDDFVEKEA